MNSSVTMARVYKQFMPATLGPTVVREKTTVDVEVRIFRIMHTFLLFSLPRQACGTLSKLFCTCAKISDEEEHQNHKNTQCQLLIKKNNKNYTVVVCVFLNKWIFLK
jgi:hypothetical protein